jgi:hypothetical protein
MPIGCPIKEALAGKAASEAISVKLNAAKVLYIASVSKSFYSHRTARCGLFFEILQLLSQYCNIRKEY